MFGTSLVELRGILSVISTIPMHKVTKSGEIHVKFVRNPSEFCTNFT